MKNTKDMVESYNQAIQRPLFLEQTPKAPLWPDVLVGLVVAALLCVGALAYFDVLTK